ncbi:hypothetical protein shim_38130 [Shimia sp. SK013]|nr:hypothetical protein shim_38130 [Shimia sp. SK013]
MRRRALSVAFMTSAQKARFYLPEGLRQSAEAGEHNFLNKVAHVLRDADFEVVFEPPNMADSRRSGYSLFHMERPFTRKSVTVRRNYFYPFWQIERTHERWNWDVANARFDTDGIDPDEAVRFYRFWQKRLYDSPLQNLGHDGFVYVPLQGKLLEKRSFQHCSPVEMIGHTLAQEPNRKVIAALHPKESYTEEEFAVLERLEAEYSQLELRMGDMEALLSRCDYVVTQNSSVAFSGFFFGKPCVLFGLIDFHHIAANVSLLGVAEAFYAARAAAPEYALYVWWFLQKMSINAGRPEAEERIRARLLALDWPV